MKKLTIIYIIFLLLIPFNNLISKQKDQCFECHSNDVEDRPGKLFKLDIHRSFGVTCANCHGGDSKNDDMDAAMNKNKGFLGIPGKDKIMELCLSCHSNQDEMAKFGSLKSVIHINSFKESVHTKNNVLTCVTCHGIHNIRKVTDPRSPVYPLNEVKLCSKCHSDANYMKTFNPLLPTDQYDKYITSTHGVKNSQGDIKVATCSDCHSAHSIFSTNDPRASTYSFNIPATCSNCHDNKTYMQDYDIATDQFVKYSQSVHGKTLLEKHDDAAPACNDCHGNHGAIPVGVESISHICGTCHVLNAEMFNDSPHAKVFAEKNIPQCEVCHNNHLIEHPTDELLSTGKNSTCIKCHNENTDKGFIALLEMKGSIDSLLYLRDYVNEVLYQAENKGMDVSDARFDLNDLNQILITARTITHKANLKEFNEAMAPGFDIVNGSINDGKGALEEYYFRRWGLGGSTLIITILAIALFIKIRRIEKKQKLNESN